ncbi:efflux transporter periplasmic adaptor subunit [Idiomarina tyrosinivorans]|uniref:Efflux transporter periplasmic adaptor subunit n=1 Tax=Idiomarina tyrosinivorans TaxID=1445662 RepID=A0A432ZSE4_9GAMM|nr:HlyD family efflux transporter periplasmic adaptor subunit [Idiomarina tyrosinivorans]RUO80845.1 efflux transporter periplasmic adaptor subunit [Idiomarina tyrosinivorans]
MKKIADTSGQDVVRQPSKRKLNLKLVGLGAAIVVLLIVTIPMISSWSQAEASVGSEDIRIATVTRDDFIRDVSIQGRVVAAVSPTLYAPAEGIVTYQVDAGDEVKKGQLLAKIDSPELANQLQQEKATLDSLKMNLDRQRIQTKKEALENQKQVDLAQVTLTAANREKRRADEAWKSRAISQIDYEKAQDDLENAKVVYKHAVEDAKLNAESLDFDLRALQLEVNRQQLLVRELQRQVDGLEIRSPVDGIVGNRELDQKNQVAKNQAILSVVDLTAFEIEIGIPESYADDLAIGMDAEIDYNGQKHPAKLVAISPEIRDNEVIGTVRFADSMPAGLRQNQRLTTRVLLEHKENVLTVQRGPFLQTEGGRVAYLVNGDVATKTPIVTGASSLNSVEILDGVKAGDQIIVSNTERFNGATTVKINR